MLTYRGIGLTLALLWVAAIGCGGDDEAGLGGVGATRKLDALDAADWRKVCRGVHDLVSDSLKDHDVERGFCLIRGTLATLFGDTTKEKTASCEAEVQSCLDEGLERADLIGSCSTLPPDGCDISNAELERCWRVQLDELRDHGRDQTCSDRVAELDDPDSSVDPAVVDACRGFIQNCKHLFGPISIGVTNPDLDAGTPDAGTPDLAKWEAQIRDDIAEMSFAGCSAPPAASKSLDELAARLARDWNDRPTDPDLDANWHTVKGGDLAYALGAIDRFFDKSFGDDAGCPGQSYGLGLALVDGQPSIAFLIAPCRECDGECKKQCE